ncbi:hypothetical protein QW131_15950 [Roseibium salinum]|nr:hypothetical protein [Roseibium salinum]
MLDGVTQVTTADEFIYHEMMSHVPILAHGAARNVLIVGGGDCGLAEEVLKHASVDKLVQVEIDGSVVDFSREHFGDFNQGVLDDPRFELVIADGIKFSAETERRFDVVIVDSTDPHGPGAVLFSEAFYRNIHRLLTPGGVLVTQNGVPFLQKAGTRHQHRALLADLQGCRCLCRRDPDLFRRPHGAGLGERQSGPAPAGRFGSGGTLQGSRFHDAILHAGRSRGRLCAAALHSGCGRGRPGESLTFPTPLSRVAGTDRPPTPALPADTRGYKSLH